MTQRANGESDASHLVGVDPTALNREELVDLVRALQRKLAGPSQRQLPAPAAKPGKPAMAKLTNATYTLVFDGGSLGNPGLGYGSYEIIGPHGSTAANRLEFGQNMTNNQAEFLALIAGLETLVQETGGDTSALTLAVRGDSQLVIRGLKGEWKIKHPGLQPLFRQAKALLASFASVDLAWHPRRESVRTFGH